MNIIQVPSPNFFPGRNTYQPIAIVIHIMEGSLGATDSWFKSPVSRVSAHYGVGKNGDVHQYVQEKDSAWHAGRVDAPTWRLIKPSGPLLTTTPTITLSASNTKATRRPTGPTPPMMQAAP